MTESISYRIKQNLLATCLGIRNKGYLTQVSGAAYSEIESAGGFYGLPFDQVQTIHINGVTDGKLSAQINGTENVDEIENGQWKLLSNGRAFRLTWVNPAANHVGDILSWQFGEVRLDSRGPFQSCAVNVFKAYGASLVPFTNLEPAPFVIVGPATEVGTDGPHYHRTKLHTRNIEAWCTPQTEDFELEVDRLRSTIERVLVLDRQRGGTCRRTEVVQTVPVLHEHQPNIAGVVITVEMQYVHQEADDKTPH